MSVTAGKWAPIRERKGETPEEFFRRSLEITRLRTELSFTRKWAEGAKRVNARQKKLQAQLEALMGLQTCDESV